MTDLGAYLDWWVAEFTAASCDTLPKGQDAKQGLAGTEGSAVGSEASETPNTFTGTTFETRKERALRETPPPSDLSTDKDG